LIDNGMQEMREQSPNGNFATDVDMGDCVNYTVFGGNPDENVTSDDFEAIVRNPIVHTFVGETDGEFADVFVHVDDGKIQRGAFVYQHPDLAGLPVLDVEVFPLNEEPNFQPAEIGALRAG